MPSSSTGATYSRSNAQYTGAKSEKIPVSLRVPAYSTYNIDRFAQESGKELANGQLRSPIAFRRAETQAESEARMQAKLRAFDEKFNKSNGSSGKVTDAKQ